ncbi:MAG: tyrosine recombinase XerC [Mycobacteriales bacterium]
MSKRRRFGRLRRLPSGRWQASYLHASGEVVNATQTFGTKTEADRYLAAMETDLHRGDWRDPRVGTEQLRNFALRWVRTRRVNGKPLAPRTVALYEWQLEKHILPTLGRQPLRDLDTASVRRWYEQLVDPDSGPGPLSAAKCYRLLRAVLNSAVRAGEIRSNPCTLVGAGDEHTSPRPAIALDDVFRIATAVPERWNAFVPVAAFGGLRIGELAGLTRNHVDLERGTVSVVASAAYLPGGRRHVGPPKSTAGIRVVALPAVAMDSLRHHLTHYAEPDTDGLVFVGPRGAAVRETTFGTKVWRPTLRKLELSHLHFHDLRGFAATLAAVTGATTAELMYRLGHATPDLALRYQRATADRDAAIARDLDALLNARTPKRTARRVKKADDQGQQGTLPGL